MVYAKWKKQNNWSVGLTESYLFFYFLILEITKRLYSNTNGDTAARQLSGSEGSSVNGRT
jgi:uncharacterized protein YktB (UPF0637 family)